MRRTLSENEKTARQIFATSGTRSPEDLLNLARRLRDEDNNLEYSYRLLSIAAHNLNGASQDIAYRVRRDLVICTYKNPDQPPDQRLKTAEAINTSLLQDASLSPGQRQDALGIMGAIWKQR